MHRGAVFKMPPASGQGLTQDEFRVTLLGTGDPAPAMNRFGPGVLVQAAGKNLLIDARRGSKAVMHGIANPCRSVRLRPAPPIHGTTCSRRGARV
jgi:hypothetical protein